LTIGRQRVETDYRPHWNYSTWHWYYKKCCSFSFFPLFLSSTQGDTDIWTRLLEAKIFNLFGLPFHTFLIILVV